VTLANRLNSSFSRFALVGVVGFAVDAGITLTLQAATSLDAWSSRLPAFAAATLVTYAANRHWTFAADRQAWWLGYGRYIGVSLLGLGLNYAAYLTVTGGGDAAPWRSFVGIAVGSIIGLVANFTLSRRFVFAR
jgi:putative flippase GtrA